MAGRPLRRARKNPADMINRAWVRARQAEGKSHIWLHGYLLEVVERNAHRIEPIDRKQLTSWVYRFRALMSMAPAEDQRDWEEGRNAARRTLGEQARDNSVITVEWKDLPDRENQWGPSYYSTYDPNVLFKGFYAARDYDVGLAAADAADAHDKRVRREQDAREQDARDAIVWARQREQERQRDEDEKSAKKLARMVWEYKAECLAESVETGKSLVALEQRRLDKWDREGGPKTAEEKRNYRIFLSRLEKETAELADAVAKRKAHRKAKPE